MSNEDDNDNDNDNVIDDDDVHDNDENDVNKFCMKYDCGFKIHTERY